MVGAAGIEPTTSSPPDLRDTTTLRPDCVRTSFRGIWRPKVDKIPLRYAPKMFKRYQRYLDAAGGQLPLRYAPI